MSWYSEEFCRGDKSVRKGLKELSGAMRNIEHGLYDMENGFCHAQRFCNDGRQNNCGCHNRYENDCCCGGNDDDDFDFIYL